MVAAGGSSRWQPVACCRGHNGLADLLDAEDPLKEEELKERSHVLNAHSKSQMVDEVNKAELDRQGGCAAWHY